MIQFLSQAWLWAGASILIPLVVHFWSKKEEKPVPVGSVRFLRLVEKPSLLKRKWSEWLLFFLRALFLLLLTLLLAEPVFTKHDPIKGWIVISPGVSPSNLAKFNSILKAGFELHSMTKGFPKVALKNIPRSHQNFSGGIWEALDLLDTLLPKGLPLWVITTNRLSHFSGERARLHRPFHLSLLAPNDSSTYAKAAWRLPDTSYKVFVEKSTAAGNSIKSFRLSEAAFTRQFTKATVPVWQLPLHIDIYSDPGRPDATYLLAALEAIRASDSLPMTIREHPVSHTRMHYDQGEQGRWIFWLSHVAVPQGFRRGTVVFSYGADPGTATFGLYSRAEDQNGVVHYYYSGELNPERSDFVWNPSFVRSIRELLLRESPQRSIPDDNRVIDTRQAAPEIMALDKGWVEARGLSPQGSERALNIILWILVLVTLAAERLLSNINNSAA